MIGQHRLDAMQERAEIEIAWRAVVGASMAKMGETIALALVMIADLAECVEARAPDLQGRVALTLQAAEAMAADVRRERDLIADATTKLVASDVRCRRQLLDAIDAERVNNGA